MKSLLNHILGIDVLQKYFRNIKLNRIRNSSNCCQGEITLNGLAIEYANGTSLYHEYKDIFEGRIYHFKSDNPSPRIIDAGGCIGVSTLYFKSVYPGSRITVFEPDPSLFYLLELNMKNNGINNVELVNAGLGKHDGVIKFYPDRSDGGSLFPLNDTKPIEVRIEKLSTYINEKIDLLKMNIEGMEGEVFEEIEDKLHLVREIIFEYHAFDSLPQNLYKILEILVRKGFRYIVTDASNAKIPLPFALPEGYRYFNLVYAVNRSI